MAKVIHDKPSYDLICLRKKRGFRTYLDQKTLASLAREVKMPSSQNNLMQKTTNKNEYGLQARNNLLKYWYSVNAVSKEPNQMAAFIRSKPYNKKN